ncbi:MAG: hypothetical protein V4560_08675 [Bacteroidota bacterium]|jgi:hypothetical protein
MDNPISKQKIDKWYNVNVDTYKVVYDLALSRFEDVLSESESVTEKSIKMITAIIVFVGFFATILVNDHLSQLLSHIPLIAWSGGFIFIVLCLLVFLLFPKRIRNRGLSPSTSIINGLDNEEDRANQLQLTYYNTISQIQSNIDFMVSANRSRHVFYTIALIASIFILAYIPSITVYIILYRS